MSGTGGTFGAGGTFGGGSGGDGTGGTSTVVGGTGGDATGGVTAGGGGGAGAGAGGDGLGGRSDAGSGGGAGTGSPGPTSVALERAGGLSFCIEPGQVLRAQIVADTGAGGGAGSGSVASGEIHRGWNDPASCASRQCSRTEPLGPAPLSATQKAELEALMAALPTGDCLPPSSTVCDPCLTSTVTVDGVRFVDDACVAERCPGYQKALRSVIAFFDRLVPQCSAALPLRCGDRVNHDTAIEGRANVWGAYGRTARGEFGRETVYAFAADRACTVVANLKNLTTDLDLLLLSACDPIGSNTMVSSTPLDLQTVETLTWTTTPGRMSFLVVDGYAGAEGSYTLEVDCTCP